MYNSVAIFLVFFIASGLSQDIQLDAISDEDTSDIQDYSEENVKFNNYKRVIREILDGSGDGEQKTENNSTEKTETSAVSKNITEINEENEEETKNDEENEEKTKNDEENEEETKNDEGSLDSIPNESENTTEANTENSDVQFSEQENTDEEETPVEPIPEEDNSENNTTQPESSETTPHTSQELSTIDELPVFKTPVLPGKRIHHLHQQESSPLPDNPEEIPPETPHKTEDNSKARKLNVHMEEEPQSRSEEKVHRNDVFNESGQLRVNETERKMEDVESTSSGSNILIFLVVAVIVVAAACFGYKYMKKRKAARNTTAAVPATELKEIRVNQNRDTKQTPTTSAESKPLLENKTDNATAEKKENAEEKKQEPSVNENQTNENAACNGRNSENEQNPSNK